MSIGKRVVEAIEKYFAGDAEGALIPTSIAIDATAQKFYGKQGRGSYKQFLSDNLRLITRSGLNGRVIANLNIAVPDEFLAKWPDMKTGPDNLCPIQDIFYHVVRCGLLHSGALPAQLKFESEAKIIVASDLVTLPSSLVLGFLVAVIACPANAGETLVGNYTLGLNDYQIPLNILWGKKDRLWNLYVAMDEIWKD